MDFVKKHYEKILFSVVLLGLVGALVFLPFMINSDRQRLAEIRLGIIHHAVKPLEPLNLAEETNASARLQSPYKLDFSTTNKLFNPLQWKRRADGTMMPVKPGLIGPEAAVVTRIAPLYFIITLDSAETNSLDTNALAGRFVMSVERQGAAVPGQRGKRQHYASVGEKIDAFIIRDVKGSAADPAQLELTLQLADTGERVTVSRNKPYRRVDGYLADLKYDPEGKKWQGQRINADLKFADDEYIIVAINQDSVILSAKSNQKKTTLKYSPSP